MDERAPKMITEEPCVMEMSRGEVGPETNDESKRSLKEKLKDHYNKGMKKNKKSLDNVLTPECLNSTAVPIFLFTFVATMKIGVLDVMPLIYAGDDLVVLGHQLVVLFIGAQMFINWLGIRYMSSTYKTYKRRFFKENIENDMKLDHLQVNENRTDSSSAVPMSLLTQNSDTSPSAVSGNSKLMGQGWKLDSGNDLAQEAAKANKKMYRMIDEENNGIRDLIKMTDDSPNPVAQTSECNGCKGEDKNTVKNPTPVFSSATKTVTYPYWSWIPCYDCGTTRPPRCHHCPICKTCVLKRDHHCYFAGSCVGYRNLRFFYIFLVWSCMGSMWATLHGFPYIYQFLWDDMSYVDVVFFFAIVRWIFGYGSFQAALSVTTLSLLLYFDLITTTFIYTHSRLIDWGLTSFEKVYLKKSLVIQDTRSRLRKIQSVFGKNWITMFFVPIHFFVEPDEDPVNWPHIKVHKN